MEENPIEMNTGDRTEVALRDENDRKNITKSHFRLKDKADWKSIYTSSERLEMERHRKRYEKALDVEPCHNSESQRRTAESQCRVSIAIPAIAN